MDDDDCSKLVSKLIWEVSQRPVLYDPQNPMYKDNQSRARAWHSIAEKMNMPVTNCQIKWGTLRRCLANARKRQKRRQSMGSKYIKKWRYQDEMSFLLPYIDNRELDCHFGIKTDKVRIVDDGQDSRSHELYISEEYEQSETEDDTKPTSEQLPYFVDNADDHVEFQRYVERASAKNQKSSPLYETDEIVMERCESEKEYESTPKPSKNSADLTTIATLDELDTFFFSMSKTLKKLPKLEQIQVRSKVYELVTQAELNWLQKNDSRSGN